MNLLTREELKSLFEKRPSVCVSLFMRAHRAGREIRQDPIRLKNLLKGAESTLRAKSVPAAERKEMLEPARKLLNDSDFWRHQDEGLAIFLSRDFFRCYRVPLHLQELLVVTDRFQVKPLLPLFTDEGKFYVLALSQNRVKLLQGTRFSISEVDLTGVPASLADALKLDEYEKQLQLHTVATGGAGTAAVFHGHGATEEDTKEKLFRYFRSVDKGIHEFLKSKQPPLVLAGVEYLFPIYREANRYPGLLSQGIHGNPENLSAEDLHSAAWHIVEPHFLEKQQEAMRRCAELRTTGRSSSEIREILPAARRGRVECACLALGVQQWGTFDPDHDELDMRPQPAPGDEDLLNLLAIHTIVAGGSVHAVPPHQMPPGQTVSAVFRY